MIKIEKTQAEVTNYNARKEPGEDGLVLAGDLSVTFSAPREAIDALFADPGFTAQFYSADGDTRIQSVYPIHYKDRIEGLRVSIYCGKKTMVFEGARIAADMKLTPQVGNYVRVECKLQVHPTCDQSGRLHETVKEMIDIALEPLNRDIMDDEEEAPPQAAVA